MVGVSEKIGVKGRETREKVKKYILKEKKNGMEREENGNRREI